MDASPKKRWPIVLGVVLGALIAVVAIGLFVLDSVLTGKAHEQAAKLSQQLGRPVAIGSVSTRLLTGAGAVVKDVQVGPAAGEGRPLAQLKRIDVRIALLRAALSRGKDVVPRSARSCRRTWDCRRASSTPTSTPVSAPPCRAAKVPPASRERCMLWV